MIELTHFIVFSGIFWGLYHWLLRKETFFFLNRIYLLVTPLLTVLLPFFKIEQLDGVASVVPAHVNLPSLWITDSSSPLEEATTGINTTHLLIGIYGIGLLINGILFLHKILKIRRLKKMGRVQEYSDSRIIWLPDTEGAFSFWGTAFIGEKLEGDSLNQVLLHEQEHIRQKHSWDLCYYETLRTLFWFNPFLLLMHRDLSEIHEFAVDREVTQVKSKKDYVNSLLNVNFQTEQLSFTNSFLTQNQLKIRIMMLYKKSSHRLAKLKYASLLPLLGLMIFYVSCTNDSVSEQAVESQIQENSSPDNDWKETQSEKVPEDVEVIPFAAIETSPEFLDAPEFQDEKERKKAYSNSIQNFVSKEFNAEVLSKEAEDEIYRINTQFMINEKGKVKNIRVKSNQPELEEEAQRVIAKLPDFKPAQKEGNNVRVIYQLPIIFKK